MNAQVLPRLVEGGQEEDETAVDAADEFDLNEIMAEKVTAPITSKEEQLQKVGASDVRNQ